MRKQDIKPGVVYAYQRGDWDTPSPVVFLSTDLYRTKSYGSKDPGWCVKGSPHDKRPQRGYSMTSADIGYPVVRGESHVKPIVIKLMERLDTESVLRDGVGRLPEGARLSTSILVSLSQVVGIYADVMAEREAQQQHDRELAARRDAERQRDDERGAELTAAFAVLGVEVSRDFRDSGRLTITLDEAGKLIALLPKPEEG